MDESKIKLLIFDFDGTIADTKKLYFSAIRRFLRKYGCRISDPRLKKVLGMRMEFLLKELKTGRTDAMKITRDVNDAVVKNAYKLKPCSNIKSINKLKFRKILVTNSLRDFVMPAIRKFKLNFEEIMGAEDFRASKQEEFRKLFAILKVKPHEVVYIGDRAADAEVARISGCKSIILSNRHSWSSLKEILKEKPDAVISDLIQIKNVIKKL